MVWGFRLDLMELQKVRNSEANTLEKFNDFLKNEIQWVESKIESDIRNNSAWNYRFNIVKELGVTFEDDFQFVTEQIKKRVTNEAAWNYFNGLPRIHHEVDVKGKFIYFLV
jgi:hypothetical protein